MMWLLAGIGFIFGAFAGSFWHVCIHRLPRAESITHPASRCYACGTTLTWRDNIPLVGWLLNRGRCRFCGAPIAARYLLVELVAGIVVAAVVVLTMTAPDRIISPVLYQWWGVTPALMAALIVSIAWLGTLLIATVVDWKYLLIPDEILLAWLVLGPILGTALAGSVVLAPAFDPFTAGWLVAGMPGQAPTVALSAVVTDAAYPVAGLIFIALLWLCGHRVFQRFVPGWQKSDNGAMWRVQALMSVGVVLAVLVAVILAAFADLWSLLWAYALLQSAMGAVVGWGVLAIVSVGGTALFRRFAMGLGDVKLLAPMGALLGPWGVLGVFGIAVFIASVLGVIHICRGGGREIPFGPSLAIAGVIVLFWGQDLARLVMPS